MDNAGIDNIEESENPDVQKRNRQCHLCEVLLLVFLTLLVCGLFVLRGSSLAIWVVFCLAGVVLFFILAVNSSKEALKTYRSVKFKITSRRLETLKAVGVPKDVIDFLEEMVGKTFEGEREFFEILEDALGKARTREVTPTIFKYAKFES
jgi:hypothetical protein